MHSHIHVGILIDTYMRKEIYTHAIHKVILKCTHSLTHMCTSVILYPNVVKKAFILQHNLIPNQCTSFNGEN